MLPAYLAMCAIFGTTFFAIRVGLDGGLPPFLFAGLRFFLAGAGLLPLLAWAGRRPRLGAKDAAAVAAAGVLMTSVPYAALFWGEQHVSSGTAAFLVSTAPIFTALIAAASGEAPLGAEVILGLVVSVAGTAAIVADRPAGTPGSGGTAETVGKVGLVLGELAFAVGAVRSRSLVRRLSPFGFNAWQMLFGSLPLLALAALLEQPWRPAVTPAALAALAYLTVAASMIGLGLYYWLLARAGATFPTTWTYVSPVIALGVGAVWLGERPGPLTLAGCAALLAGTVAINWKALRHAGSDRSAPGAGKS